MIKRSIKNAIIAHLGKGKAIIIYGARQVGKTTLVKEIGKEQGNWVYLSCDEPNVRERLTGKTSLELMSFIGNVKLVVIDEAQRVSNIGLTLKLLVDNYPGLQIIATGSSSFELANKIKEPLTGRAFTFHLYPLSLAELTETHDRSMLDGILPERVRLGMYPAIATANEREANDELRAISTDYLYRDLLSYEGIRKPDLLDKLTRCLAGQVGSLVSYSELANTLDVSKQTIENYLGILEQAFIVFSVTPFARNVRSELTKKRKIYFYDTGVRNALLDNLNPLDRRTDTGALWENFVIAERMKLLANEGHHVRLHFWRTHDGQELDLIETEGDVLRAFEIKFRHPERYKIPPKWSQAYPAVPVHIISRETALAHLLHIK